MTSPPGGRIWEGAAAPRQAWPETDGPPVIALARHDPDSQTVSLILDATTASTAIFAFATHAGEREAHIREVERHGQNLPEGFSDQDQNQAQNKFGKSHVKVVSFDSVTDPGEIAADLITLVV